MRDEKTGEKKTKRRGKETIQRKEICCFKIYHHFLIPIYYLGMKLLYVLCLPFPLLFSSFYLQVIRLIIMSFLDITLATLQPSDVFKFDRNGLKPVFIEWISTSREWKRLLSSVSSESPLTKNCIKTNIDLESLYPRLRLPLNWESIKHKEGFEIEEIVKDKVCAKLAREWQDHIDNKRRGTNEKGGEGHVARDPRTRAEKIVSEEELVSLNNGESTTASATVEHSSIGHPSVQHPSSSGSTYKQFNQN